MLRPLQHSWGHRNGWRSCRGEEKKWVKKIKNHKQPPPHTHAHIYNDLLLGEPIPNQYLPSRATGQSGINHLLIVDAEHVDPTVLS